MFGGLAGCSARSPPILDLVFITRTDRPFRVEMALFETGADAPRSEARTFPARVEVGPGAETRRDDVADVEPDVVRYLAFAGASSPTGQAHVHYDSDDSPSGDGSGVDIGASGELTGIDIGLCARPSYRAERADT